MQNNHPTRERIKQAAKELIFCDGIFDLTTVEIAHKACLTRTVVHYHYRFKEKLISQIFYEALEDFLLSTEILHAKNMEIREKVSNYIDHTFGILSRYPYRDFYLMTSMLKADGILKEKLSVSFKDFLIEIDESIVKKELNYPDSVAFFIDMVSLTTYPFVMRRFLKEMDLGGVDTTMCMFRQKEQILKKLFSF